MKYHAIFLFLVANFTLWSSSPPAGFVPLFNGMNLDGWWGAKTEDPDDPSEDEPDARASSIIGRIVIPSTTNRSNASPAASKSKPARSHVTPTSSAPAPPSKSSLSQAEQGPLPEKMSRSAARRSTIDTTSDGRVLRLQQDVHEEVETLDGDL